MKEESPPPRGDQQDDPFFQPHLTDSFSQVNHTLTTREGRFPGITLGLPLYKPANDQAALRTKFFCWMPSPRVKGPQRQVRRGLQSRNQCHDAKRPT
jgi:hypothetical protein